MVAQPSLFTGEQLKEAGIARVECNTSRQWRDAVLEVIKDVARRNYEFTADEIHEATDAAGVPPAHHPNAWGAVIRHAQRLGYMSKTGMTRRSKRPNQHSTDIPLYVSNDPVHQAFTTSYTTPLRYV